jgi:hypothetical protein
VERCDLIVGGGGPEGAGRPNGIASELGLPAALSSDNLSPLSWEGPELTTESGS